jgi:hypothetical protein
MRLAKALNAAAFLVDKHEDLFARSRACRRN